VDRVRLYTIGFTKKSAEIFFSKLKDAGVVTVIDIRLSPASQLSGFAKGDDLQYFLRLLCNCNYVHWPMLTPTKDLLDDYRNKNIDWSEYERRFRALIKDRQIENKISLGQLNNACFLCSEPTPQKCHRRLVVEYLKERFPEIEVIHL
jgi:uncharacterized protein (DUF488 family)